MCIFVQPNTLLLYPSLSPHGQTDGRTEERNYPMWAGHPHRVPPGKKKDTVVCLAGCAVVSVFGSGGKLAVFLLWREIFITTGKKKIQSSVWRVRDHYYNRKKIQSSTFNLY